MEQQQFLDLLKSLSSLTPDQISILLNSLPDPDSLNIKPGVSQTLEAIHERFMESPCC